MCDLFLAHTSMATFVCVFRPIATFLHGHPLEPCVPPMMRRFSTVTRPPPADMRELAGALCAAYDASFFHGHPSTSGRYEIARWSPVSFLHGHPSTSGGYERAGAQCSLRPNNTCPSLGKMEDSGITLSTSHTMLQCC